MSSSNDIQTNPGETSTPPKTEPPVAQPTPETTTTITTDNNNNTNTATITTTTNNKNNDGNNKEVNNHNNVEGTSITNDNSAPMTTNKNNDSNIKEVAHHNNGGNTSEPVAQHKAAESTTATNKDKNGDNKEVVHNDKNGGKSSEQVMCSSWIWASLCKDKKKHTAEKLPSLSKEEVNKKMKEEVNKKMQDQRLGKLQKNLTQVQQYLTALDEFHASKLHTDLQDHLKKLQGIIDSEKKKEHPKTPGRLPEINKEITKLMQQISSPDKLTKKLSLSTHLQPSNGSHGHSGVDGLVNLHKCESFVNSTFYKEIEVIYRGLDESLESHNGKRKKFLLSCFAVLPENAVVKRRLLTYWGVGEGLLDFSGTNPKAQEPEKIVDGFLKEFTELGLIEPVIRKRKQKVKSYKMDPLVRSAVIMLSEEDDFFDYDSKGNVVSNPVNSKRACLLKEEESSSEQENQERRTKFLQITDLEDLVTLFNVNEPFPDLELALLAKMKDSSTKMNDSNPSYEKKDSRYLNAMECLSKMKSVKVLCLGSWAGSAKSHIEVESTEFFKGLTSMKELMFLSLQGISRINKLPSSIGNLSNLLILDVKECHNLEDLSEEIAKLKKLKYLDVSDCHLLAGMPKGLSALSELQVLKGFVLSKTKRSGTLDDLKGLKKLRKLSIIATSMDFPTPNDLQALNELGESGQLRKLTIAWDWGVKQNKAEDQNGKGAQPTVSGSKTMAKSVADMPKFQTKLPSNLEKLDLQCFPDPTSKWLIPGDLPCIKQLYIRGGNLATLIPADVKTWSEVTSLRLKFLRELKMTWIELLNSFPKLEYLEKVKCPRISLCPCDENGVWMKPADNDHSV